MKRTYSLLVTVFTYILAFAQCPNEHHPHYIDLGLPSGKGWACCNVGAVSPEDFGGFFAYGECWEKKSYMKENYIYYEDLGFGYSIWTNIGTRTDISGSAGYDVAYKMMGEDWRMPTKKECEELVNNCTWEWTKVNGNNGYKVIGPNGNYIFLPAAGFKSSLEHKSTGNRGLYRSSMWTMIGGEALTSYVIDFNNEGVKVATTGYRANGQTVRPISSASINCYVNNSFIEEQKNKMARGFTADGKSEIAITYRDKYTILDETVDLKFYLDGQEVEEAVAGKVIDIQYSRDSISIILRAPKDFLVLQNSEYTIDVEFTPYSGGKPLATVSYPYRVLRPGVLFIHGLGDNNRLFNDMIAYLIDKGIYLKEKVVQINGKDTIIPPQLFAVDYHESNTSSFMTNTIEKAVIKSGCETICKTLFQTDSIVSAKYDMVGHSMGGILARLYVQETSNGKESTNSIITLNTPHYGSQLGNIYGWAKRWEREIDSYMMSKSDKRFMYIDALLCINLFKDDISFQAINDLAVNSCAIMELNGIKSNRLMGIPVHSICTIVPSKHLENFLRPQIKKITNDKGISGIRSFLLERLLSKTLSKFTNSIYSEPSDLVVPLSSQKGGLDGFYSSEYEGTFETAMHMNAPHWSEVKNGTFNLLQARKDNDFFSMYGFPSNTQETRSITNNDNMYLDKFEEPQDKSFISAIIKPVMAADYTHVCNISHSDDILTYEVFAMPTDENIIFGIDEPQMKFDLSEVKGNELKFYVVGRTNYNALLLDSVVVNLNFDPTNINSNHQINNNIHIEYNTDNIIIKLPHKIGNSIWNLYLKNGSLICYGQCIEDRIIFKRKKAGVYILKISKNGIFYTYKLLLD